MNDDRREIRVTSNIKSRDIEKPKIQIIVPVYNEEEVLSLFVEAIKDCLNKINCDWKILFVDDGSMDRTPLKLEEITFENEQMYFIQLSRNFGHQAALRCGYENVEEWGDLMISMDSDLQHRPELIDRLLDAWKSDYDVIHTQKSNTEELNVFRKWVTKNAYSIIKRFSSIDIVPQSSDFRAFDKLAFKAMLSCRESKPLHRGLASWVGFNQCSISYVAPKRVKGKSKYNFKQLFSIFERSIFDYSNLPLILSLYIGIFAFCLSSVYFLCLLFFVLCGFETPSGWLAIVSMMIFFNSILMIFMGNIGVYISKSYDGIRRRPEYIIKEYFKG